MTSKKEQKKPEKVSKKESVKPEEISLYDIIYCDEKRLAPILPQMSNYGLRKSISVTEHENQIANITSGVGGNTGVVRGDRGHTASNEAGSNQRSDFDPLWVNVLQFAKTALIKAQRDNFSLGKMCLITGNLSLVDYGSFNSLINVDYLSKAMIDGFKAESEGNSTAKNKYAREMMGLIKDVVETYSNSVHGSISSDAGDFWLSIDREHLVFPAEEIILKYGHTIPGTWSVLGIYDSEPDYEVDEEDEDDVNYPDMGTLSEVIRPMTIQVRSLVGKPYGQHSITPLMIMREI